MSISYRVDSDQGVVFVVWDGDITATDLAAHWTALVADAQAMRCRGSVSDIRGAHQLPHYDTLRNATQSRLRTQLPHGWKAAVIACEPHHRGVARQLAVVVGHYCTVECFDDVEQAVAWVTYGSAPKVTEVAAEKPVRGRGQVR